MINNIGEMRREFTKRMQAADLQGQCLMDGAFGAEVAVVAEAPGSREVEAKLPLIGVSGKLMFDVMRSNGYARPTVYITNVVKRQLAQVGSKEVISRPELDNWIGLLRWELTRLPNLKYIIACGGYALQALTREFGITKWRGSVVDITMYDGERERPYRVLCTYNPAMVLREPKTELVFRMDIARIKKLVEGTYEKHNIMHHINPSFTEAMDWLDKMQDEKSPVSFDIETIGGQTACIGLANSGDAGMCINFRTATANTFSAEEDKALYQRLQTLFADDETRLVAQNGNFDSYWLWYKDRLRIASVWFDTLLAHHTLYPPLPHNLGFLAAQYTTHPFYKDDKDAFREGGDIDAFWRYNVNDAAITWAVHMKMHNELRAQNMDKFFFEHVMRLQRHLVLMTVGGVKIDKQVKDDLAHEIGGDVERLRDKFETLVSDTFHDPEYRPNPNSTPQMRELFFRRLMLVGRGMAVDKQNKDRMLEHPRTGARAKEIINLHTQYKAEHKFLSTYVETGIDDDNRMRCEWRQWGTQNAPGRLSSAAVLWGTGTNLQNQPKRAYEMFVADSGYCFVYFDMAQAEARVVAWEARIEKWKEQFERARREGGYDAHRALAADMFHIPYDEVPTDDRDAGGDVTIRFVAKRCRHGLNYRMNYPRLAETTGLSLSMAQQAYDAYHRETPELRVWWRELEREARTTKMLFNCYGRRLPIMERITDEALESIVAFKPQSAIGDHVCQVIYRSHEDDDWPIHGKLFSARIALNVHDALIGLVPIEKAEHCLRIMVKHAERPLIIHGEPLIIPADTKISQPDERGIHRWSTLKGIML